MDWDAYWADVRRHFEENRRHAATPVTLEDIARIEIFDDHFDRVWARLVTRIDICDTAAIATQPEGVRAFVATHMFENECANGGLHQWFFNNPDPALLQLVAEGYGFFGQTERRDLLAQVVAPMAEQEAEWRETLRDGTIETFFASYGGSELSGLDDAFESEPERGLRYLCDHPEEFVG